MFLSFPMLSGFQAKEKELQKPCWSLRVCACSLKSLWILRNSRRSSRGKGRCVLCAAMFPYTSHHHASCAQTQCRPASARSLRRSVEDTAPQRDICTTPNTIIIHEYTHTPSTIYIHTGSPLLSVMRLFIKCYSGKSSKKAITESDMIRDRHHGKTSRGRRSETVADDS